MKAAQSALLLLPSPAPASKAHRRLPKLQRAAHRRLPKLQRAAHVACPCPAPASKAHRLSLHSPAFPPCLPPLRAHGAPGQLPPTHASPPHTQGLTPSSHTLGPSAHLQRMQARSC
ncbi:hypothetical protein L3X38_041645 [Prunus dulcis]|uniref:Uncharacterized protein n=1 Tax=Prunus dulcis TaxID=3755 RepID=A0AAD4YJH5_PRUDU|nr:hypothetical protein L3X38_041645 [Prunus dulcis]